MPTLHNSSSEKSPDAYRTISEVADELGVATHVLRFWETKFKQIKPKKLAGGRRFYKPDDVAVLRLIKQKLHAEGYTIKGVQSYLAKQKKADIIAETAAEPQNLLRELTAIRDLLAS